MRYRLWQVAGWLVQLLPLSLAYRLADAAGTCAYFGLGRWRRAAHRNFTIALPAATEPERRAIARRAMQNYCRYLVDFLRLPAVPVHDLRSASHGDDSFAALDAALAAGRGAIIVCMHFGNWDIGAAVTAARGYTGAAIGNHFDDPRLDALVFGARQRLGVQVFPVDGSLLPVVRHLRRNGVVALFIDEPDHRAGVDVTFFGRRTSVPQGPARLALRSDAAFGVAAFPRLSRDRPEVAVLARFRPCWPGAGEPTVATLSQWAVSEHERYIRQYPDQWYAFRPIWPESRT